MSSANVRPFLLGLTALALAFAGQWSIESRHYFDAALFFGAASLLFVVAFWPRRYFPESPLSFEWVSGVHLSNTWSIGAIVLTGAAMALAALPLRTFDAHAPNSVMAWWQHLGSIALLLAAAAVADAGDARKQRSTPPTKSTALQSDVGATKTTLLWLAGILALSALLRIWRLDVLPFGVWYDEAEHGLQARRILESPDFRPIFEGAITGPAHFLYLVAGSFSLFGVSVQSIRLVSALFGIGAVLAGYVVGRELFGRNAGLILAFLLAVSSWSVTLSRFGMYATATTPFFTLLTLAFLLRAFRRGAWLDFAMAGLAVGLGLCFYTSFRLFIPVVAIFWLLVLVRLWWSTRRPPGSRFWLGAVLAALMAVLVVAPLALFAYRHPDVFWSRVETTYIFSDKGVADQLTALADNAWKHLLMFNAIGDPNGRHNLPGAPMLDTISAALMVIGLAYSLRRIKEPRYALLVLWPLATLLGGILSLGFEAPQSLRANGSLAAVYVLAVVPLAVMGRAWRLSGGRYYPRAWVAPVLVLLAIVGGANLLRYFDRQANDFSVWNNYSTPETLTAQKLQTLPPDTDAYVTVFFDGHPTLNFLVPPAVAYRRLETTERLPLDFAPDRNALLIMEADQHAVYDQAQRIYPNAVFEQSLPPMKGPPVLYTVLLSKDDIASVQGLTGRYFAGPAWEGEPDVVRLDKELSFDWPAAAPLPQPFSVEWEGILHANTYGLYDFIAEAPAQTQVLIGEQAILSGTGVLSGSLTLAEGNHALRVRAQGAPGKFALAWRTPETPLAVIGPGAAYIAPMTANGLLARYYGNADWSGSEAFARIEDNLGYYVHVTPLPRPYTVEYTGKIAIPLDGLYRFGVESIDQSSLWIDDAQVAEATEPNVYSEGEIDLTTGLHDIRIRFADLTDHTHLNVFWMPPGGDRQILPSGVLFPPQGGYTHVQMPDLASIVIPSGPAQGPKLPAPLLPGKAQVVASELLRPRGVAVAPDGKVYVAEGEGKRVQVLLQDGTAEVDLQSGSTPFVEPSDIAAGPDAVYVLDAGAGRLLVFKDGENARSIEIDSSLADRARGLAIDQEGTLWMAATPTGQIVRIDPETGAAQVFPVWPGESAQPADVAVGLDGYIFVTDGAPNRLVRLAPDGNRERAWPLPPANTLESPHLAVDELGNFYVTDPEAGRVVKLGADGEVIGAWNVSELIGSPVKAVGIAVGPDGRIWVTDSDGGRLVAITPG